jgi:hypothetical protein
MLKKRYVVLVPSVSVTEHYVEADSEIEAMQFVKAYVGGFRTVPRTSESVPHMYLDVMRGTTHKAIGVSTVGGWQVYDSETDEWAEKEESIRQSYECFG